MRATFSIACSQVSWWSKPPRDKLLHLGCICWSKVSPFQLGINWPRFTKQQKPISPQFLVLASVTKTFTFTLNAISFNWGPTNLKTDWASTLQLASFHLTPSVSITNICHFLKTKPLFFEVANQVLGFQMSSPSWGHAWSTETQIHILIFLPCERK